MSDIVKTLTTPATSNEPQPIVTVIRVACGTEETPTETAEILLASTQLMKTDALS